MSHVRSFRDLDAWQMGMRAVELTYRLTADFPDTERFGLVSQMRRAAVSVPSNVAEGQAVRSTRWSLRFFAIAIASLSELDTQLEVALRLRFVDPGPRAICCGRSIGSAKFSMVCGAIRSAASV